MSLALRPALVRPAVLLFLAAGCLPTLGSVASAQTLVSGLIHAPAGSASFSPPAGRSLEVHNLGNSGNDGAELHYASRTGGGVRINAPAFPSTPGATLRRKYRGWDGLIYGNHRFTSNGDGTAIATFDFTSIGAVGVRVLEYSDTGALVSDTFTPGPIVNREWVPNFTCPDGSTPIPASGWRTYGGVTYYWIGWTCGLDEFTYEPNQRTMQVIPQLPVGTPGDAPIESVTYTATSLPSFSLDDARVNVNNIDGWALGTAVLSTGCANPADCPLGTEFIASHIDASGAAGLHVNPPAASAVQYAFTPQAVLSPLLPGEITTTAFLRPPGTTIPTPVACRAATDSTGRFNLTIDASHLASDLISVTGSLGGSTTGGTTGSASRIRIIVDGIDFGTYDHIPFWVWQLLSLRVSNLGGNSGGLPPLVTIDNDGIFTSFPADSLQFDFHTPQAFTQLDALRFTAAGLPGESFRVGPFTYTELNSCPADFNGDTFVDDTDFVIFAQAYDAFTVPPANAACDLNSDTFVDDTDFVLFAQAYDSFVCP